jgi:hypothetical protein
MADLTNTYKMQNVKGKLLLTDSAGHGIFKFAKELSKEAEKQHKKYRKYKKKYQVPDPFTIFPLAMVEKLFIHWNPTLGTVEIEVVERMVPPTIMVEFKEEK